MASQPDATVIDSFRDMCDREVAVVVYLGQIRITGGIRLNAQQDVDRFIAALQRARDTARGGR